jgi:hypothetical protein
MKLVAPPKNFCIGRTFNSLLCYYVNKKGDDSWVSENLCIRVANFANPLSLICNLYYDSFKY